MMPPTEVPVRVLVLLVYTATAAWVSWVHQDSPVAVIHIAGVIAGVCALSQAVSYAGLIGAATPDDSPDQADDYIERTEWDD